MEIRSSGGSDFLTLSRKFRAAGADGKALRRNLTRAFNDKLKPVIADVKHTVERLEVKGVKGRGSLARARALTAADLRRVAKAEAAGKTARRRRSRGSTGLRAAISRGVKSRVQWSGIRYGVRIYVDASTLPQSQRKLPRYLDKPGGWRHPVWGHRDRWVQQSGKPWFYVTIKRHEREVRRFVERTVTQTLRTLR